ncbi:replication protein A 32 kDa subunit isoform X1 [Cervus canadensis]|uniref:replication protein A 32 kDa subunit isoform X1 n=2 Tax=Cervus TaxID=9859 RepID=UPI0018B9B7BA|nr:replication protein A 32 kDa subunit isoform X1 [Cervus canadensis]
MLIGSVLRGKEFVAPAKSRYSAAGAAGVLRGSANPPDGNLLELSPERTVSKMWNSGFESYSTSSFGGASSYTQSPGGFGSPTASQAEKKSRARAQHIVPCTISQLLSATLVDEVFRIGNVEISQVTIVGIIRNAEKAATNIVYKIDDMTAAPMDVRQWVDTDDASSENTVVPPETYVKVAGHLRSFQNKKSLVAFKIMPLEDMNEFTTHILEVVNAHMMLSKPSSQPSAGRAPISNPGMSEAGNFSGNNFIPANGLTVAQNQVLNLIKACPRPEGLNFQDLKNQLQHMSVASIKLAVDFLSNEGHIYSTVDDDHFKSTDAE